MDVDKIEQILHIIDDVLEERMQKNTSLSDEFFYDSIAHYKGYEMGLKDCLKHLCGKTVNSWELWIEKFGEK